MERELNKTAGLRLASFPQKECGVGIKISSVRRLRYKKMLGVTLYSYN